MALDTARKIEDMKVPGHPALEYQDCHSLHGPTGARELKRKVDRAYAQEITP